MLRAALRQLLDSFHHSTRGRASRWPSRPLRLFQFEDRIVPAQNITVILGVSGSGTLDAALTGSGGTVTTADGPSGGTVDATLSTGALGSIPAGNNISVTAAKGITFSNFGGGVLTLQTGAGNSATFTAQGGALTFANTADGISTAGGGLNLTTSASETLGQLFTTGGVNLTASSGGLNIQNNITAGSLTATASDTGVAGDNLTVASGVTVSVGPGSATLQAGDNLVVQSGASVGAGSSLTLTAGNADSGDQLGALTVSGTLAGGAGTTLNLSAMQDVTLGGPAISFPTSTVNVTSTRGGIIDGNDPPAGTLNVTAATLNMAAARGIGSGPGANAPLEVSVAALTASNTTNGDVQVVNFSNANNPSGNLSVSGNNAGGGAFAVTEQTAGAVLTVGAGNVTTAAGNGPITLTADDMTVTGTVTAGFGVVTLQPTTAARPIDLGTNSAGATLGLTDAELDKVSTASILRVGNAAAGSILVSQSITQAGSGYTTLSLRTAGGITQSLGTQVSVTSLSLQGAAGVNLPNTTNDITNLAGAVTAAGAGFTYVESTNVVIGVVDGVAGVTTNNGAIDIETFGNGGLGSMTVANNVNSTGGNVTLIARSGAATQAFTLNAGASVLSSGGSVVIGADNMNLNGTVNSGAGRTTLRETTSGTVISLGGADATGTPATLGLSPAELNAVTAAVLQVGDNLSGFMSLAGAVAPTGTPVLSLQTGGSLNQIGGSSLTIPNLAIRSANGVALILSGIDVTTGALAAQVTAANQTFGFIDANGLTIGTVDGLAGITTNAGLISVTAANGNLTVNNNVSAGAAQIFLQAQGANSLLTNNAAVSTTGGNVIALKADRMAIGGGTVSAGGGARVTLSAITAGQLINLGSAVDTTPSTLELSGSEVATVSTTGVLQIGVGAEGAVTISAPVNVNATTLTVANAGPITESAGGTITALALRLSNLAPGGAMSLTNNNQVGTLAASVSGAGNGFAFTNAPGLTVGTVDGVSGVTTAPNAGGAGAITIVTVQGDLTISDNVVAGAPGANGGAITLTSGGNAGSPDHVLTVNPLQVSGSSATLTGDEMVLGAGLTAINVGTGAANVVTIQPFTANRPINLGPSGDPAGSLNLSDAELDTITAGLVRIGNATAGTISVTALITQAGSGYTSLSLTTGGQVTSLGFAGAGFSITSLAVRAGTGVILLAPNNTVTNLAGVTAAGPFSFTNTANLFVNTVDGAAGITTTNGQIFLSVAPSGGLLTVQNAVSAGNANVFLNADDMDLQATVSAGTAAVTLVPFNVPRVISLGSNVGGTLGLLDAELDHVTAGLLRIGTATNTGNINVTGQVTQAGSGYATLSLVTGGAITDATPLEQPDVTVASLALQAAAGIGSADDLNVAVSNLAASNITAGSVQVSNTGGVTIPATPIDGVTGVTEAAAGNIALRAASPYTISAPVTDSGGGNISITTTGAGGSITVTATGSVTASGGNGNITLDSSGATSGGTITVNNGPNAADISAAGTGNITLLANDAVVIGASAVLQSGLAGSGGGTITLKSNAGDPAGTDNITLGANAQVLTRGAIVLNADPDANGVGGNIVLGAGSFLGAPGGGSASTLSLTAAGDITLSDLRAVTSISVTSTGGSIRDDGIDTSFVQAPAIALSAAKAVGGDTQIAVADVLQSTAAFLAAIDIDPQGGTLTVTQTGTGGNVQLRRVNALFNTSILPAGFTPAGIGNQLALIGAAGLTVNAPLTETAANNANLLLAATGNPVTVSSAVTNNGATGPTTLVASGGAVNVNAAVTSGGPVNMTSASNTAGDGVLINANVTATGAGSTIVADAGRDILITNPAAVVSTTSATGGAITFTSARNLPGFVTGGNGVLSMANGSTISTAANNSTVTLNAGQAAGAGDDITLATVTAGTGAVNVRSFRGSILDANGAGVTNITGGAITLQSDGPAGINTDVFTDTPATAGVTASTTNDPIQVRGQTGTQLQIVNVNAGTGTVTLTANNGNLTNLTPNDLVADVIGSTVTLAATGVGTIGRPGPLFFEIDASFLNASTQNQNLWVSDVAGGVSINSVNAGTASAILQSNAGAMVSTTVDGAADVVAATVILRGTNNGSFGTSMAGPLEIDATTLNALTTGTGSISVRDTAGGVTVQLAQTANGPINLEAAGPAANLVLTQVIAGSGNTVTVRATGAVNGTPGGATDVTTTGGFAVVSATGVASVVNPLETAVGTLAANVGNGGVFVTNAGNLTVGSVSGVSGVTSTGGNIALTVNTADNTLTNNNAISTTGAGTITLQVDRMALAGGTVSTGSGRVTLKATTAGRLVNLGSATDVAANTLELSGAELATITTTGVVQIGGGTEGALTVSLPVTVTAGALSLVNNGPITETGTLTTAALRVSSPGPVALGGNNSVGTLAASVTGAGNAFTFNNAGSLIIFIVDGVTGVTTNGGPVAITTAAGNLTVNSAVAAGTGSVALTAGGLDSILSDNAAITGSSAVLTADRMALAGSINVGSGPANVVTLQPFSVGRVVKVGTVGDPNGELDLSNAELATVTAGILRVGSLTAGNMTVTAAITAPAGWNTLSLLSGGTVTQTAGSTLTVTNLDVQGTGGVALTEANDAVTLAGRTTGFTFNYHDANTLAVGTVDGVSGIATAGGDATVTVGGDLTVGAPIAAGAGRVFLNTGFGGTITSTAAVSSSGTSVVFLTSHIALQPGSSITAPVGSVFLQANAPGINVGLGTVGSDGTGLNLSQAELNTITASILEVIATHDVQLTAPVVLSPAQVPTLLLQAGLAGAIVDATATEQTDLTVQNLALLAGSGIGSGDDLNVAVANLAASNTLVGSIQVSNTGGLTLPVGGVAGVVGVTESAPGNVALSAASPLTVDSAVSDTGGGNITLTTSGAGGALTVTANGSVNASGGTGNITLTASGPVTLNGPVSDAGGSVAATSVGPMTVANIVSDTGGGSVTLTATGAGGSITVTGSGSVTDIGGGVSLNSAGAVTVGGPVSSTGGGSNVTVTAAGPVSVAAAVTSTGGGVSVTTSGVNGSITVTAAGSVTANGGAGSIVLNGSGPVSLSGPVSDTGGNVTISAVGSLGVGAPVSDGGGNIALSAASPISIDSAVSDTGGGNITITTAGPNGSITVTANGSITASGGNGNITLDSSAATSGGVITVNNGPNAADISAAGTGAISLLANDAVVIGANAVLQSGLAASGGGTVTLESNVGDVNGIDNVTVGAGAQLLTRGNVVLNADPDGNCVGGSVVLTPGSVISAPGGGPVGGLSINSVGDLVLTSQSATTALVFTTCGNIRDDGNDTTFVTAPSITLTAGGAIGGASAISAADVISQSGAFPGALDLDLLGGTLTVNPQTGAGGNIQLRMAHVGTLNVPTPAGTGNQLAEIFTTQNVTGIGQTLSAANNANLLVATENSFSFTQPFSFVNNGATSSTTLVAVGGHIGGAAVTGVPKVTGNVVNLITTGGAIGTSAAAPLEIDATTLNAASGGGNIFVTDTAGGVAVGLVNAGSGNVTLTSVGNSLTSVTPNDNVADVIGNVVTLAATGPTNGATGQIGFFTSSAQFFEVQANVLNASANNSRLWIAAEGSVQVGHIAAGSDTAILKQVGGAMTSLTVDGVADVVAGTVILRGISDGSFGAAASPLEIDATTLNATTVGAGLLNIADTAGGVSVALAQTVAGPITLAAEGPGGNLALTTVNAPNALLTLSATGTITGTPGGTADVTGPAVSISGVGVGSLAAPLELVTGTVAAVTGTGGFFATAMGPAGVTVGSAGGVNGITSGGSVRVGTTAGGLTVAQAVSAAGDVTLTANEAAFPVAGNDLAVAPGVSVGSTGGAVTLQAGDALTLPAGATVSAAGVVTLNGGFNDDGNGGSVTLLGAVAGTSLAVLGGSGPDAFVINPASAPATTVSGLGNSDSFAVTPSATTAFTIHGGSPTPPANPGDALAVDLTGVTTPALSATFNPASGYSGSWTFGNRQPIAFDTIETLTPVADLSVTMTDGTAVAGAGGSVTYTIVVGNAGPSTVTGATIADLLPPQVASAGWTATASAGSSVSAGAGAGNINLTATLAPGGTVTITLTAQISVSATGSLVNTVTVTPPANTPDLNPANNSATDTDAINPQADVGVTVGDTSGGSATAGSALTFVVVVTNNGPSAVSGVGVTDHIPAGLIGATWTAVTSLGGSLSATSGNGDVNVTASLPAGGTARFTITGVIDPAATGAITDSAAIAVPAGVLDLVPGNDTASDTVALSPQADLGVVQVVDTPTQVVGGTMRFTVLVTNRGPSAATGVTLADIFTGPFQLASVASSQGSASISGSVVTAVLGTLAPGASALVTVLGIATVPGTVSATATVALGGSVTDPNPGDNSFTATAQVVLGLPRGLTPTPVVVGSGAGGEPAVHVYNPDGSLRASFLAFSPVFNGGVRVASGDVNGDGVADIIVAAGAGGGPHVKVIDGSRLNLVDSQGVISDAALLHSFFAYPGGFTGGVWVAAGDVDGDGKADVITGAGAGGGPHVKVFSGATGQEIRSFFAYDAAFTGGVTVAAADLNGDGKDDIVTGAGPGGGPHVKAFDAVSGAMLASFFAYDAAFTGGVFVAATDGPGLGGPIVAVGAMAGGGSHVKTFVGPSLAPAASFFAYNTFFFGGVSVGFADPNGSGRPELVTGAGPSGSPHVRAFDVATLSEELSFYAFDPTFIGGVFVG